MSHLTELSGKNPWRWFREVLVKNVLSASNTPVVPLFCQFTSSSWDRSHRKAQICFNKKPMMVWGEPAFSCEVVYILFMTLWSGKCCRALQTLSSTKRECLSDSGYSKHHVNMINWYALSIIAIIFGKFGFTHSDFLNKQFFFLFMYPFILIIFVLLYVKMRTK